MENINKLDYQDVQDEFKKEKSKENQGHLS